jgi:hypothetical protein
MQKQVVIVVYFILLPTMLFGQLNIKEIMPSDSAARYGITISDTVIRSHLHLYKGTEYVNYDNHIEGHQFFESEVLEAGDILYNGILYLNVPMVYDIMKDEVMIEHFHKYYKIKLLQDKITYFSLLGHTFVKVNADSLPDSGLASGFYEKLYEGKLKLLAKRIKDIEEEFLDNYVKKRFVQEDRFYLKKDENYVQLKGKNAIMRVLKDRKRDVRRYIQENNFDFKNNPAYAFTSISRFYDNLPKE